MLDNAKTPITIKYIKVQSLIESRLEYFGKVSKRHYIWANAGDIVPVLEDDAQDLLNKRLGRKVCCGTGYNRIFQEVL